MSFNLRGESAYRGIGHVAIWKQTCPIDVSNRLERSGALFRSNIGHVAIRFPNFFPARTCACSAREELEERIDPDGHVSNAARAVDPSCRGERHAVE
jgi:hypothetical protein